ncbi:hypothetical protein OG896_24460 [Streptomyces sp. NBC_00669]|uniref:hypothetical protein n=1 Tax=Streptomyces sp. NBC_00669 TaxID=2976011 RepID=UPI002E3501BC|nr:hypothetical protein [Streptomyces sp. NBC_00669]
MDQTAEDDAERARNRAKLYAPPAGTVRAPRTAPAGGGMQSAMALVAQLEAEDAALRGTRSARG